MNSVLNKVNDTVFELKYGKAVVFWYEQHNSRGKKEYIFKEAELRQFLKKEGFRNYEGEPIYLKDNIATRVHSEDIFKHVLRYIETFEDPDLEGMFVKRGESLLLKNKAIVISLPDCEIEPLKDTRTTSYKFYNNGIVKVQDSEPFEIIPYEQTNGFVWDSTIKERDFELLPDEEIENAVFAKFIRNVTNSESHFDSVCTAIGYLIHTYKDQRKPIAIIVNDENLVDEGKPEGGTGKGLIIKAISQIVEKASYNGKNADFTNNKFAYQNVENTTALLLIDDAPRNFDFEALFSVLTDDFPIEKKHKPVKVIPYEKSPKFVITTNYTIKGDSSSFKRRRFDIFLNNYYNSGHSPSDDFGHEFFHGWGDFEWNRFDLFMMACLRSYLTLGLSSYEDDGLKLKMLKNETSSDFFELMEEDYNVKQVPFTYISIRQKLIEYYGEKYYFLERNKKQIVEWVERYADHKGLTIQKSRTGEGSTFKFAIKNV